MKLFIYKLLHRDTQAKNSWDKFKKNINCDPSAIIDNSSSVNISGDPKNYGVCVEIGEESQLFGHLIIQKPGAYIKIGARTQIGASQLIAATRIEIGNDVLMAWNITIMDNDSHSLDWKFRKNDIRQFGTDFKKDRSFPTANKDWTVVKMAPIYIKSRVWIGFNVSILKGVTIGEGAVIGAGSVVTNDIPPYTLAAGNPARVVRQLSDYSHE